MSNIFITEEFQQVLEKIRDALKNRPTPTITGSEIHAVISTVAPSLNIREIVKIPTGPGALTKFIYDFLSDSLVRTGNQGGDTLYSIQDHRTADLTTNESPNLWRAFVSPASPDALFYNTNANKLECSSDKALSPERKIIQGVSYEEHNQIRAEFESTLDPKIIQQLEAVVGPRSPFTVWITNLKALHPFTYRAWGEFRRKKLINLFEDRISTLETSDENRKNLVSQLSSSIGTYEKVTFKPQDRPPPPRQLNLISSDAGGNVDVAIDLARTLLRSSIDNMSYTELRAIAIPLGALVDAMLKNRR